MLNFYEDDTYDSDRSLEFRNRLRDLVENEKFRQRLKGKLRKSEKLLTDRSNDAPVTIPDIVDAHRTALRKDGWQLFDDEVIKKLPKPHAVLVSDLVRSACRHLAGAAFEDSQWDVAYSRFVRSVSDTLFISFDQEFAFDGWNDWDLPRTYNPWQAERTYNLWPSKTGLDVRLKLSFHSKQHELQTRLWIMSTGYCSEGAFESFHKQVQRVLPVILNCCRRAFSADHDAEWKADLEKTCELLGDLFGDQSSRESEDRPEPESEDWAEPDTADSEPGPLLFNERNFVRGCVDSYFHDDDDDLVLKQANTPGAIGG